MLFFDGSFGTYYKEKTRSNTIPEEANLINPEIVYEIHREYIEAGAYAITTNTFAANSSNFSTKEEIVKVLQEGLRIAKEASQAKLEVFSSIGYIYSQGDIFKTKEEEYLFITKALLEAGSNNFLFETFPSFQDLEKSIGLLNEKRVFLSFSVNQDGYSHDGFHFIDLIRETSKKLKIDGIGLNCMIGPLHMYRLLKEFKERERDLFNSLSIIAMPNSGYPARIEGAYYYEENANYFARTMLDIRGLGVEILGGCCGTQPIHIKKMVDTIKEKGQEVSIEIRGEEKKEKEEEAIKTSQLLDKFRDGKKVIAVELDPPFDTDISFLIKSAKDLKSQGVDLITVADSPLARTRACSFMIGASIKRQASIDVMPHLTCRDKNNIAIASSLLGGKAEGIDNVLCVTGDPAQAGSKGVFAFNSFKLIEYISRMNKEQFISSPYAIGAALNTSVSNFDQELERAKKKLNAGANFFLTQPIYTKENIDNLLKAKKELKEAYILAGILPLASYKNALFLNHEVSGISIPNNIIEALEGKDREESKEISLDYTLNIIEEIFDQADGLYLMLPLKRLDLISGILQRIESW